MSSVVCAVQLGCATVCSILRSIPTTAVLPAAVLCAQQRLQGRESAQLGGLYLREDGCASVDFVSYHFGVCCW